MHKKTVKRISRNKRNEIEIELARLIRIVKRLPNIQ